MEAEINNVFPLQRVPFERPENVQQSSMAFRVPDALNRFLVTAAPVEKTVPSDDILDAFARHSNDADDVLRGWTSLQSAVFRGDYERVLRIIHAGFDVNETSQKYPIPGLFIAATQGNPGIFGLIIDCDNVALDEVIHPDLEREEITGGPTLLHCLLSKSAKNGDYEECLKILLSTVKRSGKKQTEIRKIINYANEDDNRNTPLMLAARKWNQETMLELLKLGANVSMANGSRERPMHYLKSDVFEQFLEYCVHLIPDEKQLREPDLPSNVAEFDREMTKEKSKKLKSMKPKLEVPNVVVNFSFLAPPLDVEPTIVPISVTRGYSQDDERVKCDLEDGKTGGVKFKYDNEYSEMETLLQMSNDPEERYNKFLSHPVIKIFLQKKWSKVKGFYNCGIRMHLMFAFAVTWYILERFASKDNPQCWPNKTDKNNNNKDNKREFGALYVLFCILFGLYSVLIGYDWYLGVKNKKSKRLLYKFLLELYPIVSCLSILICKQEALHYVIIGYLCIFALEELIQVSLAPNIYLKTWGNYLDVATLTSAFIIVFDTKGVSFFYLNNVCLAERVLASFIMIAEWGKFISVLVQHPLLGTHFQAHLYIPIFFKVMQTFLFFFIAYGTFLFTYALGFFVIFHDSKDPRDNYISPWLAFMKTSAMFVGEINFDNLAAEKNIDGLFPHLFFASFLVIIVIVLMNLLNALIIGDTGEMLKNADIIHIRTKINTIMYLERMLGAKFGFLARIKNKIQNEDIFVFNDNFNSKSGLWHLKYDNVSPTDVITAIRDIVTQKTVKKNEDKMRQNSSMDKIQEQLNSLQNEITSLKNNFFLFHRRKRIQTDI